MGRTISSFHAPKYGHTQRSERYDRVFKPCWPLDIRHHRRWDYDVSGIQSGYVETVAVDRTEREKLSNNTNLHNPHPRDLSETSHSSIIQQRRCSSTNEALKIPELIYLISYLFKLTTLRTASDPDI